MWTVYILKCSDGKFYTGCTSDLDDRMKRHHAGAGLLKCAEA
ncbi:MAG: GIY-YIG nuclease family protein [Bacteroidota bacterium]